MKVELTNVNLKKLLNADKGNQKVSAKKAKESADSESDTVKFSEDLKKAESKVIEVLNYPEKRTEKIQELKEMIKSGKYNVNVHKLTDKIIEDLLYGNFYQ